MARAACPRPGYLSRVTVLMRMWWCFILQNRPTDGLTSLQEAIDSPLLSSCRGDSSWAPYCGTSGSLMLLVLLVRLAKNAGIIIRSMVVRVGALLAGHVRLRSDARTHHPTLYFVPLGPLMAVLLDRSGRDSQPHRPGWIGAGKEDGKPFFFFFSLLFSSLRLLALPGSADSTP